MDAVLLIFRHLSGIFKNPFLSIETTLMAADGSTNRILKNRSNNTHTASQPASSQVTVCKRIRVD
jgi:hypothetical protein